MQKNIITKFHIKFHLNEIIVSLFASFHLEIFHTLNTNYSNIKNIYDTFHNSIGISKFKLYYILHQ